MSKGKNIYQIIKQKKDGVDPNAVKKWLKDHEVFVKELDADIVANMYLQQVKAQERLEAMDTIEGYLLGTVDRKFSSGLVKKVYADILTKDSIERVQWWGSVPRENKHMQELPILQLCSFKGAMSDLWTSPTGIQLQNFDVEAIEVQSQKQLEFDEMTFPVHQIVNANTDINDVEDGTYTCVILGKIVRVAPYRERTWDDDLGQFVEGGEHPFLMSNNLCMDLGVRVIPSTEDEKGLYIRVHLAEQKLGWPSIVINDDLEKVNGIKQILASMPVNAESQREMEQQLAVQTEAMQSMFLDFNLVAVGSLKINRVDYPDGTVIFADMIPSLIGISSESAKPKKEAPSIEESAVTDSDSINTMENLLYEASNQIGPEGEVKVLETYKQRKTEFDGVPITEEAIIVMVAKDLNIDLQGFKKFKEEEAKEEDLVKKMAEEAVKKMPKKPMPDKPEEKKPTKRKSRSKYDPQYDYISEVLDDPDKDGYLKNSALPMEVWDILAQEGYIFEQQPGKMLPTDSDMKLSAKIKKKIVAYLRKNKVDLTKMKEVAAAQDDQIKATLTQLKTILPNATPEQLQQMLETSNPPIQAPVKLIAKIWSEV